MFIDWLDIHQDFAEPLPLVGKDGYLQVDVETGRLADFVRCSPLRYEGSYSTSLQVRVHGYRLSVSGNPSRFNRLENLFGFESVDACVRVINHALLSLGLPPFTKCSRTWQTQAVNGTKHVTCADGAIITQIHVTTNRSVGQGNTLDYLRALSSLRYRNSIARLHTNGRTVDWLSALGNAPLIYPSAYDKAHELERHSLPRIRARFGDESPEYQYLRRVLDHCKTHGVVRFEQKIKSEYLRRQGFSFWGLSDYSRLQPLHDEFLHIDSRLQVTAMDHEHIAERLLRLGIVTSRLAANTTALYAVQWMHGHSFDLNKKQVQTHRARLRQLGIDIKDPCDLTKFCPVFVKELRQVTVSDLAVPSWYQRPTTALLKAA